MLTLSSLLTIIFIAIIWVIVATSYFKLHPIFSLLVACFIVGFSTGMNPLAIIDYISEGFGNMLGYIGLVVVLGAIIGILLEHSGALNSISIAIVRLFGAGKTVTSITILGSIISIPVFCDSGFVILSRLARKMAEKNNCSSAPLSIGLGGGLYITHTLVPPTPGPIAVAGNIHATDYLGLIILMGAILAVPLVIITIFMAQRLGKKIQPIDLDEVDLKFEGKTMKLIWAVSPIAIPLLFITSNSVLSLLKVQSDLLMFLGDPLAALLTGCFLAMLQLHPIIPFRTQGELIKKGIAQAGPIVLITGVGGAFGNVLKATPLSSLIEAQVGGAYLNGTSLIITAFMTAAALKTAQGSSTSALVIASSLLSPVILSASLSPLELSFIVMAFGGGAMTVSHANDSYFWVVSQFSGFTLKDGYRTFTLLTLVQGLSVLTLVLLLYNLLSYLAG